MSKRYREYRKYGHGRIVSALHAPTFGQLLVSVCVAGFILGILL